MRLSLTAFALAIPAAFAQPSAFAPDPARAPAEGSTWHFIKSNRDGSKPWPLVMHVVSPTQIEVVKSNGAAAYVEVHALVDLQAAMPVRLQQWNIDCGERQPTMTAMAKALPGGDTQLSVQLGGGQRFDVGAGAATHFWGFDLTGFALLAPHLRAPQQSFVLGFVDPNQRGDGDLPFKTAAVRFEPAGSETVGGRVATRYKLSGALFGAKTGNVWLSPEGELLKADSELPTSTDWRDWKLERVKTETLSRIGWERYKLALQRRAAQAQADDPACKKP